MDSSQPQIPRRAMLAASLSIVAAPAVARVQDCSERSFAAPSGYGVEFRHTVPELIGDLLRTERGDPKLQAVIPHHEWYSEHSRRTFGSWGPSPRRYPPPAIAEGKSVEWRRERVIATALRFVGYAYQHHHIPDWDPPADWPWKSTCAERNGKGFDCSNFTSFVYNQAFGVHMNSDVERQSELREAELNDERRAVRVERITLPEDHAARLNTLRTGDLLYILGKPGGKVTHVVLWIGSIGRAASGLPLILDSHGGGVEDDQGRPIPCGVQLRPFRQRSWYDRCASHAHRLFEDREERMSVRR